MLHRLIITLLLCLITFVVGFILCLIIAKNNNWFDINALPNWLKWVLRL